MEYKTEFDKANRICIVRVTGTHKRPKDSLTLQQFARDFGEEQGCKRFLFDMTQAEIVGGTIDTFETGTVPIDPDYKQAEQKIALAYTGDMNDHKFMETVAGNRGYQVRVFNEIETAIEWLTPADKDL